MPDDVLLVWNDDEQIGYEPKIYYEFVGGTTNATLAGTYTYQIKPAGDFEWKDGIWTESSKETKTISWTIAPLPVDIPATTNIVYDGAEHVIDSKDLAYYNVISGINVASNAWSYSFTVSLIDPANTEWSDGTTTDKTINWAIVAKPVEKPTLVEGLVYSGTNSIVFTEYEGVVYKEGLTNSVNAGYFHYTVALDNPVGYTNYVWVGESGDASVANFRVDWMIASQLVNVPVPLTGLVYNGSPQDAFEELDWAHYSLVTGSTTNEMAGGSYEAVFHLLGNSEAENFVWNVVPETSSNYTVPWSIGADTNEITELKLVGWRIGAETKTPTISAKWGADTVEYYYGFGDDAESVTSWTNDTDAITTPGTWVLRAVIPETESWTAATNTTTFLMWDDPGVLFHNCIEIFVKGTTSDLSNFVVPIRISEDSMPGFYYDEASPTNLVFIDDLGNLLTYDVDTWNTSGESVVWVKLVTLPMAGMPVTMYWNLREGQVAPENTSTDVWSDYIGVWHLSEASGGLATVKDASGHQDGTGHGSSLVADGIFGKSRGRNVTGAKGYAVAVPEYPELDALSDGAFTISGWINLNNTATAWAYLFARKNNDDYSGWAAQFRGSNGNTGNNDGISFFTSGGGNRYTFITTGKFTTAGVWMKYDFVRSGTTLSFYLNGILVNTVSGINPVVSGDQPFTIGGMNVESTDANKKASTLNGYSDEVRLMPAAIDSAHIAADYKYQSDPTMSTNGVVYLDGLKVDYWVVEPEMDKTTWDVNDNASKKGKITNPGQLRYGTVTNYTYSVYDASETYSTPADITNAGNYRVVFTQVDTNGFQRIEKVFEIRVTKSKPYTKIGGTNGNSGRVLLMNRDTNTKCAIDFQGIDANRDTYSTFWEFLNTDGSADGTALQFNLQDGTECILWTKGYSDRLWHLVDCRHGNTYPKDITSGSLVSAQNYLPYSSTSKSFLLRSMPVNQSTAGQVVMRNIIGAAVYSPCYTNGIGTIYFDAVNGWAEDTTNYTIVVEYATNTVDHLQPIDANCVSIETNIVDEVDSIGYMVVTNGDEVSTNYYVVVTNDYGKLDGCWHAAEMIPFVRDTAAGTGTFDRLGETTNLALAVTHGGTKGNFYRVVVPLDYHESIRFRIKRCSFDSSKNIDKTVLILLDNIIASVPAMGGSLESLGHFDESKTGHEILGWELATSVPYPSIYDDEIIGGAKPSFFINAGDGTTWNTNDFFQSATMHYRWRYLNQTAGPWSTIELNPYNGFKAMSKFEFPGRACDVEYWYDYRLQAPYYEYVDYSGIGKQIDYTEERGMQTNRLGGATLASAGTDWFFRVREGRSDYSGLDIVYRRSGSAEIERAHMTVVDDHVWRGFVQTKENQAGEILWRIEALDEQTAEFPEYAVTTNYWYNENAEDTLPLSGSLKDNGTDESWTTLAQDAASGYIMFQIDESVRPRAVTVVHADYQNANGWSDALNCKVAGHSESIFVGTSTTNEYKIGVSPSKQLFTEDFSDWGTMVSTNEAWTFPVGLADIQSHHMEGRKPYVTFTSETNGYWDVGQGMWVAKKYMVATNNAGVALQMEGNGKGYFQFTNKEKAPRGLESISFNARLGQFVQFDDFAYYYAGNILTLSNYTFMARTAFDLNSNNGFDGNASLSMVANYLPNKGCYEARWEWLGNGSNAKRGQRMCIYRWNVKAGRKTSTLIVARTNTVYDVNGVANLNSTEKFYPMFISVSNDVSSTYIIAAVRKGGALLGASPLKSESGYTTSKSDYRWFGVCARDTSADRLKVGSYGVLTANSDGVFARPEFSHTVPYINNKATDSFGDQTITIVDDLKDIKNCAEEDLQSSEYPGWNIIPGRMTNTYSTVAINAVMSAPLEQYLQVYLGTAGRTDWGSTPYTNIALKSFGGSGFTLPFYTTKDCSVKFAVAGTIEDVRTDVVIDSVVLKQWRGGNWDDDDVYKLLPAWADDQHARSPSTSVRRPGYTNFVFTAAWVTNNTVLLSAKRANLDVPSSIRAPLMDGYKRTAEGEDGTTRAKGLGMISIEYANAQENAELELQISTNSTDWTTIERYDKTYSSSYWTSVTNFKFSAMNELQRRHGVLNHYIGMHDVKGAMRVIVSTNAIAKVAGVTDTSRFGDVSILAIAASDEPAVDVHSWWGWNMRTVGGDEDGEKRMLLADFSTTVGAAGLSVALNNSVSTDFSKSLINLDDRESYLPHKPFVQTPTFTTNFIGEVSFKARKYNPNDPTAAIVAYGSKDISNTDEGTWRQIPGAVFYVTNSWYETYSFKTPSETFRAIRLAISGVEDVTEGPSGGGNNLPEGISEPQRVLVDEVFVCEAILPRMGFKNVGCFSVDMSKTTEVTGVPSAARQPLCGEAWGVQCEVYAAQLASDIDLSYDPRVRFHWFMGSVPWGYENWKEKTTAEGRHSEWLSRATDTDRNRFVYRSSLRTSPNAVVSMSTVAPTYAQYMLEVVYYTVGGALRTNLLTSADWQTPSWYNPLDLNADPKFGNGDSFAAYNILDNVPPGWAWINEINIFGHYERLKNTEADCQFIEIAHPPESDITGWTVRLLEPNRSSDLIITNVLARFGTSGLKGTKAISAQDADVNMVFRVIANQEARKSGKIEAAGGEVEAVWNVDNPTTLFTSAGEIGSYDPFVYQLVRTSGIVEHEIMLEGTNFMESLNVEPQTYIFDMRDFVISKQRKSEIVLPGLDIGGDGNSLSVTQNFGRCGMDAPTNDWTCYVAMTPSHKNIGQVINPNHPVPSGEEILVYLTVSGDHIMQSLDGSSYTNGMFSLVIPKNSPAGTNVFYSTDPWYVLGSVRTGSVSILDNATRIIDSQPYVYRLDRVAQGISNGVTVVASAAIDQRIASDWGVSEDNPYRPAIIDWLEKGVDVYGNAWADIAAGEIRLAQFMGLNADVISDLTLTEMYWLDMDPTVGNLALIGGMVSGATGPVVDEHIMTMEPGGNSVVLTNRRMTVYMMITNRTDDATSPHYGQHWTPYVLRGLTAGSNSLGYGTTMSSWDSVTFKITGMIINGNTSFDNIDNKVPLRHFVFNEHSFGANGLSRIEVVDPYSTLSFGYMSGWKNWWDKHGWCPVVYFWTLDTRLPQMGVEMLKEDSWYGD